MMEQRFKKSKRAQEDYTSVLRVSRKYKKKTCERIHACGKLYVTGYTMLKE